MIIEKEEIYTFKLISGEEIIAKVKEISSVDFVLDKPVMVLFDSQTGIQLLPVAFTADLDKTVGLNTRAVAMIFVTIESIFVLTPLNLSLTLAMEALFDC